jgi:hypothetical protein
MKIINLSPERYRELFPADGVIINESRTRRVDRSVGFLWNTQEGYLTPFGGPVLPTKSLPDSCIWE